MAATAAATAPDAPIVWPYDDFSAVTQMSLRAPPNAFLSASFSARSPRTVAVAWALTQEISGGPIPAAEPMLDVSLFKVPAFSAASGSVTIAFFALFGFIFLVTQYFQFIRGYSPLATGVRILPVAVSIAAGSEAGASLATRAGTRVVVTGGLIVFGLAFAWIAISPAAEPYPRVVAQMVLIGTALGLVSTPATESILSVLPPARAGTGSAVNDATREAGGTLGVAVIGSVFSSVYPHRLAATPMHALPAPAYAAARRSVAAALDVARRRPGSTALIRAALIRDVTASFMAGLHAACVVAAVACGVGAVAALRLPGRPPRGPGTGASTRPRSL